MDESRFQPPHQLDETSSRLLRQMGREQSGAWSTLVQLYGPVVRYWLRRGGVPRADHGDLFQEVFVAVHRNAARFQREEGAAKFRAWLKTITRSKISDYYRRLEKQPTPLGGAAGEQAMRNLADFGLGDPKSAEISSDSSDNADDILTGAEDTFLAWRMLQVVKGEFRDQTWQAFWRTAVDGCNSQEVAEELNSSAVAVRKAKSRVLFRLREVMAAKDPQASSSASVDSESIE